MRIKKMVKKTEDTNNKVGGINRRVDKNGMSVDDTNKSFDRSIIDLMAEKTKANSEIRAKKIKPKTDLVEDDLGIYKISERMDHVQLKPFEWMMSQGRLFGGRRPPCLCSSGSKATCKSAGWLAWFMYYNQKIAKEV